MISNYPGGGSEPTDPQATAPPTATAEPTGAPAGDYRTAEAPGAPKIEPEGTLWDLVRRLANQASVLFRQETRLAMAEFREAIHAYAHNGLLLAAGAAVLGAGILVLLAAAVAGLFVILNNVMPWYVAGWLSPLIIGAAATAVGYGLITQAVRTLRQTSIKPQKTIDTVREDAQWIKDRLR